MIFCLLKSVYCGGGGAGGALCLLGVMPCACGWGALSACGAQELSLLEGGARVFKLIGPVLVPQDLEEARGNVEKRMEYIASET